MEQKCSKMLFSCRCSSCWRVYYRSRKQITKFITYGNSLVVVSLKQYILTLLFFSTEIFYYLHSISIIQFESQESGEQFTFLDLFSIFKSCQRVLNYSRTEQGAPKFKFHQQSFLSGKTRKKTGDRLVQLLPLKVDKIEKKN